MGGEKVGFVTDAQVKTSVAAALHKAAADLDSFWSDLITDANTAAYDQISSRFINLGYSQAQIDAWDRGATFQKFLARYQALIDGAGDRDDVGEWAKQLEYWRGLLDGLTSLDDGGAVSNPTADPTGNVGHGSLSTRNDLFRLDPDDDRRGTSTQW
jgi:hypothetical protein